MILHGSGFARKAESPELDPRGGVSARGIGSLTKAALPPAAQCWRPEMVFRAHPLLVPRVVESQEGKYMPARLAPGFVHVSTCGDRVYIFARVCASRL